MKLLSLIQKSEYYDFSDVQPFVFDSITPLTNREAFDLVKSKKPVSDILAVPFDHFSIELKDQPFFITPILKNIKYQCMICKEVSPGNYKLTVLYENEEGISKVFTIDKDSTDGKMSTYPLLLEIIERAIEKMHNSDYGSYQEKGKAKYQAKKNTPRKVYEPSSVIYVGNRQKQESSGSKRQVNWSYAWEVRSHWRKIPGLGLNRLGERVVEGFTWVQTYTKGEGEVIKKVRKVA